MSNKKATVFVRLKDGVLDPQGITIQKAILNMGYDQVVSVRSGRFFELEIKAESDNTTEKIDQICSKLLSNPVIENYTVEYE
ncbi:MAG TPA: phosphoribosylformylglycinamidine synthase subunit PurS [candidate division Zixibacteria bacterium]|nr:phosphoribosylformylglycinamidine synthase subunit PurS [candidate division Zixibacteria bacterium]